MKSIQKNIGAEHATPAISETTLTNGHQAIQRLIILFKILKFMHGKMIRLFFFRQKDYNDGPINGLTMLPFMDSPKMKSLVNISLLFGILKMGIYVNIYNIKQRTGNKSLK